jgi:hypothetical protein
MTAHGRVMRTGLGGQAEFECDLIRAGQAKAAPARRLAA